MIGDVIQVYSGSHGRTIIFCETKKEANELSMNASIKQVDAYLRNVSVKKNHVENFSSFNRLLLCLFERQFSFISFACFQSAQSLHGDIPQKQREMTLKGFRNGAFEVLVATNVAARGLDIPEVDLVVQCSPPKVNKVASYL